MTQQTSELLSENTMESYDEDASSYAKVAIFTWCLVGFIYAAVTWYVLWLPGLLILFPGIIIASLIAAMFFIPFHLTTKKIKRDLQLHGRKQWGLLIVGTILKIGVFIGPIVGSIGYIHLLRYFMK
jgi:hypothetical protein